VSQSDDFQGRCFWLVPTAAKILTSDLSVPPCAKSGHTTKFIEGAEPMVPFPSRAAMREEALFESRAPLTRQTNTTKSEVREQRRPVARGTGRGSRSAPSFFRCGQIPHGRLAVVECSHGAPHGSEKLVHEYDGGWKFRQGQDIDLCIGCGVCETKCPAADEPAIYCTSLGESRSETNRLFFDFT